MTLTRRRFLGYVAAVGAAALAALLGLTVFERWQRDRGKGSSNSLMLGPGEHSLTLTFEDRDRTCLVHVPQSYSGQFEMPLVIALHGGGGNAWNIAEMAGMSIEADSEGFIVAYPNGTGLLNDRLLTWNSGNCCAYALEHNVNDVGFIAALLEDLSRRLRIDQRRIFVTGISNGGMMTYKLGCEMANRIAAIAPVAGALNGDDCRPSSPVSVIIFHGTADEHVPYEGGVGTKARDKRVDKSVAYAVSFWIMHNRCSPLPTTEEFGNIRKDTYSGGLGGTEVVLYTINGGGHAWPGGTKGYPWGDEPTQEISATKLMLQFFRAHPKNV